MDQKIIYEPEKKLKGKHKKKTTTTNESSSHKGQRTFGRMRKKWTRKCDKFITKTQSDFINIM